MRPFRPSPFIGRVAALASFLLALLSGPQLAYAQSSISGVVRDMSGGVLPGLSVDVTTLAGDPVAKALTDSDGRYQISGLGAGSYLIVFSLQGFHSVTHRRDVSANAAVTLSVTMGLDGVRTVVEIVEPPPLVFPNSAERVASFGEASLSTLPTTGTVGDTLGAVSPLRTGRHASASRPAPTFLQHSRRRSVRRTHLPRWSG